MATQVNAPVTTRNRWVRPLVPILGVLILGILFLYIGSAIATAQSSEATPLSGLTWVPYFLIGGFIAYVLAVAFGDGALWAIGTSQVVYSAVGAALYGVLSWATNVIQLPSVSLVSLRPAIVIPVFFGLAFGPSVGFFVGFVGNVLGDALTGWGVFPVWDLGNGLIGLVPGLLMAFRDRARATDVVLGIVAVVSILASVLLLANPTIVDTSGTTTNVSGSWWLPLLGLVLVAGLRFAFRNRPDLAAAQVWGALGIIIGIGFAAMADIWWNGYTFTTAFLGEFVPAGASNLINVAILLPILLSAWNAAQARTGR
jgi:energy-coupling factor transport system substrate-specific component